MTYAEYEKRILAPAALNAIKDARRKRVEALRIWRGLRRLPVGTRIRILVPA